MKKQPTREKLLDITFDEVYINGYTEIKGKICSSINKIQSKKSDLRYYLKKSK